MPHIVSTLSNSQQIVEWNRTDVNKGGPAYKNKSVTIKGTMVSRGADLQVVDGAVTKVTEEELEFLEKQPSFVGFVNRGHFKIVGKAPVIEKVVKDMPKDNGEVKGDDGFEGAGSALLESGDFKEGGRAAGLAPNEQKFI
jgi:hypothetical protein